MESRMKFFKTVKTQILYDSAIPFWGIYPKEMKRES